ncbi:autotransporter domain-containing protein [Algihabitans albus]|uniref:autotransporter domain-containing protein n=1 Tax=Algihabitans albus TaxID=2164067 RepID=UPI0035CF7785
MPASAALLLTLAASPVWAINNEADLRAAIINANTGAAPGSIVLTGSITLTQSLPMIDGNLVIQGSNHTINATGAGRAFFVNSGSLDISNLTIENAVARGTDASSGGGGGLGAGGALFVRSGAAATASDVTFRNNAAIGGDGGAAGLRGGGAGMDVGAVGVPGGNAPRDTDGADGGDFLGGGSGGGGSNGLRRGNPGGRGGDGGFAAGGGGGGNGGNSPFVGQAPGGQGGAGGFGGGGGAGGTGGSPSGPGAGGAGGFGGGGGAGSIGAGFGPGGEGGFGGGDGASGTDLTGGGGAAFGGAVFVMEGGSLTLRNSVLSGGSVTAGSGGSGAAANGSAAGSALFLQNATAIFHVDGGTMLLLGDSIADDTGNADNAGTLVKAGAGILILGGTASHTGGTNVSAGTLQLDASERLADDGAVAVAAGATFDLAGFDETIGLLSGGGTVALGSGDLTTGGAGDSSFSGGISGSGGLTKTGVGSLTLSGINSFTGGMAVSGGTLIVNGTLGDVTLGSDGILGGTGSLGALTADGRVAPGNSIGTLSSGPVTFNPGSVLAAEIAPDGRADLLDVAGTATINGGRVEVTPQVGSYSDGQQFLILRTTGGVAGTFDSIGYMPGQALAFFDLALRHQGNDLLLQLDRNAFDFGRVVTDPTLGGTATALDRLQAAPLTGDQSLLQALFGLSEQAVQEATRQLSGSGLTGGAQLVQLAGQSVLAAIPGSAGGGTSTDAADLTQFALAESDAGDALDSLGLAAATGPDRLRQSGPRFWFEGLGGFGARDAEGAADGQNRLYAGAAGGVVFPLAEQLELGLALAGFGGQVKSNDGLVETETTSLLAAAKLTWAPGPWQVSGSFGLAGHRFESERDLRFAGFDQNAEGERDGLEVLGDLAVGYDWEAAAWGLEGLTLTPTAGLAASWLYEEAWEESGAAGANLKLGTARTLSLQPRLGFSVAINLDLGEGLTLTPRGQALWIARLGDEGTDTTARFAGTTASWRVPGLDEPNHAAALSLGADLASQDGWALSAGYAGRFGEGARDHGVLLGGKIRF